MIKYFSMLEACSGCLTSHVLCIANDIIFYSTLMNGLFYENRISTRIFLFYCIKLYIKAISLSFENETDPILCERAVCRVPVLFFSVSFFPLKKKYDKKKTCLIFI